MTNKNFHLLLKNIKMEEYQLELINNINEEIITQQEIDFTISNIKKEETMFDFRKLIYYLLNKIKIIF